MPNTSGEIYCMLGQEIIGEDGKPDYERESVFVQSKDLFQIDEKLVAGPLLAKKSQGGKKYVYQQITETEGFILRLALNQLDVPLIVQALINKCSDELDENEEEKVEELVHSVINRYKQPGGFIRPMTGDEIKAIKLTKEQIFTHSIPSQPQKLFNKLNMNANINQIGPPIFMISFPPLQ